jgi:hypothetical protein
LERRHYIRACQILPKVPSPIFKLCEFVTFLVRRAHGNADPWFLGAVEKRAARLRVFGRSLKAAFFVSFESGSVGGAFDGWTGGVA